MWEGTVNGEDGEKLGRSGRETALEKAIGKEGE